MVTNSYDPVGNRTTVVDGSTNIPYTSNALNQYTTIDGLAAPQYSTNGNLTQVQYPAVGSFPASTGTWTYTYDSQNRLLSATDGTVNATFAYDTRNRQVSRTLGGVTTWFYYDDWNVVEEHTATSGQPAALSRAYLHGAGVDELIGQRSYDAAGVGGYFMHHHADGLGNTLALATKDAPWPKIVERYRYDVSGAVSYHDRAGNPKLVNGQPRSTSEYGNRFLYTGREWIAELGIYDSRNRQYSPQLGRFLQTDPIRFDAGDENLYRYVGNSPLNWVDPWGLAKIVFSEANIPLRFGPLKFNMKVKFTFEVEYTCKSGGELEINRTSFSHGGDNSAFSISVGTSQINSLLRRAGKGRIPNIPGISGKISGNKNAITKRNGSVTKKKDRRPQMG